MTTIPRIPLILLKALGPGERWITVRPGGEGTKGQPVLIRENPDGSASVIGGAGGKLNYLRLTGVKSEAEYKKQVAEKQKTRREQRAEQRKRDKEAGTYESKAKARESIRQQRLAHERQFIKQVADALGWDEASLTIPEEQLEGLSDAARSKAVNQHQRQLMNRAREAVDMQRQRLLADAEARAEADLGMVPLTTAEPEQLTVDDLAPVQTPSSIGLGYATNYKGRAAEAGLSEEALQEEAREAREARLASMTDAQRRAIIQRGETAQLVKQELEGLRTPEAPPVGLADAKTAVELLKAEKQLKDIQRRAQEMTRDVDKATEPKAYILEVSGDGASDAEIMEDLSNDLRTIKTRAFLSEIGRTAENPHEALGRHVGVGAYNSINSLSLAVGGDSLIDRSVVDVLGIAGAAQVLARRLHSDLSSEEVQQVTEGMADFHLHHYLEATEEALREAREYQDMAREIELGEAATGADLMEAQELNAKRREVIGHAERILGQTLGEMESNAALVLALKQGAKDSVQVPMGGISAEAAIQQARAIGLQRGDYTIDQVGRDRILTINAAGMDRLAKGVDRESVRQIDRNLSIIQGTHDEDNWLPLGFANRPDLDLKPEPGVAPRLAVPFEPGEDLVQSVQDYIGGRAADGDSPADILADLQSSDFVQKVGADRSQHYLEVLNQVAPLRGDDGKMRRAEELEPAFQKLADEFTARRGGDVSPIHRQKFDMNQSSVDALHRSLAEEPAGVAAYKPVGDLGHEDQRALREFFARNVAKEDPEAAAIRRELEELEANEPEKEATDMFGETATNPEWSDWKQRRDELAEKHRASSLTWADYVQSMRGTAGAYEAIQDLIRSKVNDRFAHHFNTLNPSTPLKVGRAVIRNNLAHLDTVDPAARQARMEKERALIDSLRERVQGRYASGSVTDKLNRAREEQAAFAQSQMGFFSTEDAPVSEERPLGADERHTIGHAAERQVAEMMSVVGRNFKPGQPLKLWQPTMSGKGAARQRAIKYLDQNKRMVLAFGVGSGKAQPLDAKVLTPTGWARMGDLKVGDLVISGDGQPTRVTGVFPQGRKPIYRVTFSDGAQTECCDEHLWLTQTEVERKREAYGSRLPHAGVRPLEEIRKSLTVRHGIRNHSIPVCKPVKFAPIDDIPVAPYLLGMLLGDGNLSAKNSVRFTTADETLATYFKDQVMDGVIFEKCSYGKYEYRINGGMRGKNQNNPLVVALDALGLMGKKSAGKFVPDCYKFNTFDVRLGVLQGLMDTDGTVSNTGRGVTFCTVSERLRDDVVFLVRSLGGLARVSSRVPTYCHDGEKRKGQRAYSVSISLPPGTNPFRLPRKRDIVVDKSKYAPKRRFIDAVELVGEKEAQCISVEDPSRLYVTDDLIITHNTAIMLGGMSHLHQQGKVKRGLFLVPSIVQGQFGGEALRYLQPGKFNWHAEPGASREQRIAAYKNPEHDFAVMTHQSFRDDMVHLGAKHAGIDESEMASRLGQMSEAERKDWMKGVMDREGISFDFLAVDEGHNMLNRAGKENSTMANVVDALSTHTPYYVSASGDPVKNDTSELYDLLKKMDPERYNDRAAFMRRYGVDTEASREALRREMARYIYPSSIDPDITAERKVMDIPVSDGQRTAMDELDKNLAAARIARMEGKVDVDAVKAISPSSFEGVPEDQHEALARSLQANLGILKGTAVSRILNEADDSGKFTALEQAAKERQGKPGVVFARSLSAVEKISDRLTKAGFRVATITGKDSAKEKERKRQMFHPDGDVAPEIDILIASDAGATGMNIQRGQWLWQHDTPDTAMTHAQRQGRINRIGQRNNVELLDAVSDHPAERRARDRLSRKYGLRELLTSPLENLDDSGLAYFLKQRQADQNSGQAGLF